MKIHLAFRKLGLFVFSAAALTFAACGHPGGSGGSGTGGSSGSGTGGSSGDCTPGTEACACLSGNTCLNGLTCADDVNKCTAVDAGSTSGTGGTTPGTGGSNPGTGGTTPGTGGSNPGTGGTTSGTGGSSPGTGGSTGGGTNLIANGDFSQGDTNWGVPAGSPTNMGVTNGQYCVTLGSNSGTVIVGWGGSSVSADLESGNYMLSFQVSSTGSLSDFEVHVGSAVPNPPGSNTYPIDYMVSPTPAPGNGLTTYTESFSLSSADPQAGVAFQFQTSGGTATVCIDNLTLTKN